MLTSLRVHFDIVPVQAIIQCNIPTTDTRIASDLFKNARACLMNNQQSVTVIKQYMSFERRLTVLLSMQ